jgi:SAM-dependent methyltransferase
MNIDFYSCPHKDCFQPFLKVENGISCNNGHFFSYLDTYEIPIFYTENCELDDYSHEQSVRFHDNAFEWVFKTFQTNDESLRTSLIRRLNIKKGQNILVTGVGSGHDLSYIIKELECSGNIYALDISKYMLVDAAKTYFKNDKYPEVNVFFCLADAVNLPFKNNVFDAAYHFGGINLYSNIQKGIEEMTRVVKPGGKVLFSDEGLAPWMKKTEVGKALIKNNSLMNFSAPIDFLPEVATDVNLSWVLSNAFYVIDFTVSVNMPHINLDIPHQGSRGGSIRKRYFGQLEGVEPELKKQLYSKAEELGLSRVDYLEKILRESLEK